MILVFDLDDTLYDELTYVRSGFRAVAGFLAQTHAIPAEIGFSWMWEQLAGGRGQIFDQLLQHYNIYSKKLTRQCVSVYRSHQPEIKLSPEAERCLERFKEFPKYLVTDGNKLVQQHKIEALGISHYFKHCYVTHRYGVENSKPSPYCFLAICEREKVRPDQVVYIADNPRKDFVGIKPLGFKTIRLRQGQHREMEFPGEYEAGWQIKSLDEIMEEFFTGVWNS